MANSHYSILHSPKARCGNGIFGAMWGKIVWSDFFQILNTFTGFIPNNIFKFSVKLNYRNMITDAISGVSEAVKDSRWDIYIYYCVKYRINHTASVQLKKKIHINEGVYMHCSMIP